jgi:hypothetical protein
MRLLVAPPVPQPTAELIRRSAPDYEASGQPQRSPRYRIPPACRAPTHATAACHPAVDEARSSRAFVEHTSARKPSSDQHAEPNKI